VGAQGGRLRAEQIHTPETVFHMAEESQPGRTSGVPSRPVVMGENPSNHVFVDRKVEGQGDRFSDSRTAPAGIPLLHFDDRMDEFRTRSLWAGFATVIGGEQHAVVLLANGLVKAEQGRGLQHNGRAEQARGTQPERQPAGKDPVRRGQIRRSVPERFRIRSWCLSRSDSATRERAPPGPSQGSDEMDWRNNNSPTIQNGKVG
jgi:hypothetical protein